MRPVSIHNILCLFQFRNSLFLSVLNAKRHIINFLLTSLPMAYTEKYRTSVFSYQKHVGPIYPKKAWKTKNNLLGRKNKQTVVDELKVRDNSLTNPKDIAEGFNDYCFAVIEILYLYKMKFRIDIIVYSWTCIFACLGYLIIDRFSV